MRQSIVAPAVAFAHFQFPFNTVMTQRSAEKIANVMLGVAAVGAAIYVLKTPPLRRLAWRLTVAAMTGAVPAWITREIRAGWEASTEESSDGTTLQATRVS